MKYRLIENSLNDVNAVEETVLTNRGLTNWREYLHINESHVNDFSLLKNIDTAVSVFMDAIHNNKSIGLIVD